MVKTKIAVLISGNGTNLQALIDAQKSGILKHGAIELVVSSSADAYGLKRAEAAGIATAVVTRKQTGSQRAFEEGIRAELEKRGIELIVLAGFMKILSKDFTDAYADRIINVHPSLIPAFCGKGCYGLKGSDGHRYPHHRRRGAYPHAGRERLHLLRPVHHPLPRGWPAGAR